MTLRSTPPSALAGPRLLPCSDAVWLVDAALRVQLRNTTATRRAGQPGAGLGEHDGLLRADEVETQRRLSTRVAQLLAAPPSAPGDAPLQAALPLRERPAADGSVATALLRRPATAQAVLVVLRDGRWPRVDAALVAELWGLTAAESRVAARLADGHDVPAIAQQLSVQANTVSAHLKRVLAKTGARRQAALVAMLLRSAAAMPEPGLG